MIVMSKLVITFHYSLVYLRICFHMWRVNSWTVILVRSRFI